MRIGRHIGFFRPNASPDVLENIIFGFRAIDLPQDMELISRHEKICFQPRGWGRSGGHLEYLGTLKGDKVAPDGFGISTLELPRNCKKTSWVLQFQVPIKLSPFLPDYM